MGLSVMLANNVLIITIILTISFYILHLMVKLIMKTDIMKLTIYPNDLIIDDHLQQILHVSKKYRMQIYVDQSTYGDLYDTINKSQHTKNDLILYLNHKTEPVNSYEVVIYNNARTLKQFINNYYYKKYLARQLKSITQQ